MKQVTDYGAILKKMLPATFCFPFFLGAFRRRFFKMYRRFRSRRYALTFVISLVLSMVAAVFSYFHDTPEGGVLKGPFRVVDGDTLTLPGQRLRLAGIDAPEKAQRCGEGESTWPCGTAATVALRERVGPGTVCEGTRRDRYRRLLVRCTGPQGDIAADMARQGYAVSYGKYQHEEREARAARRGLWAGPFERPADWRKARKLEAEDAAFWDWIGGLWQ